MTGAEERRPVVENQAAEISVGNQITPSLAALQEHGASCTPECRDNAAPAALARPNRPPAWPCPFCKAPAGVACRLTAHPHRPLRRFGRCHPSRMEVGA